MNYVIKVPGRTVKAYYCGYYRTVDHKISLNSLLWNNDDFEIDSFKDKVKLVIREYLYLMLCNNPIKINEAKDIKLPSESELNELLLPVLHYIKKLAKNVGSDMKKNITGFKMDIDEHILYNIYRDTNPIVINFCDSTDVNLEKFLFYPEYVVLLDKEDYIGELRRAGLFVEDNIVFRK